MAKTPTQFGTFEELLQMTPEPLQPIIQRLKEIVLDVHPDATEVVRLGDRAATYGLGPKKMSEGYVYLMPHKAWVNLGFYKGALLDDPEGLMEGTGAKLRHVKIRTAEAVEQDAIRTLIEVALAERKEALGR